MVDPEDGRRFAVILNGEVVDIIPGDPEAGPEVPDGVGVTWRYESGAFLPPAPPVADVPALISRQQAAGQLLLAGMATAEEAVAMAMTGTPPAFIEAIFAAMPPTEGALSRIGFAKGHYERGNPLLVSVLTTTGATSEAIDDFFRAAAAL